MDTEQKGLRCDAVLAEVSGLAGELSLPATNPDGVLYARRIGRTLVRGLLGQQGNASALVKGILHSHCGSGTHSLGRTLVCRDRRILLDRSLRRLGSRAVVAHFK